VSLIRLPADTGTAKFDLSMGFWKSADGTISLGAEYSLDLFEAATVRRMLGHFRALLAAAVATPESRIADLPLLADEEREQILAAWSEPAAPAFEAAIAQIFTTFSGDGAPVPTEGCSVRVLDPDLQPAPVGVPGELYLAGVDWARGPLGPPERIAERFLPDPFGEPGARMVRTGERARLRSDGELEILGRLDEQAESREDRPASAFLAPRTPLEQQITAIWQEILQVGRVGVHDNFWDMGGHSLLATRIASRVREIFGVELPLRAFFERPMIAGIAEAIAELMRSRAIGSAERIALEDRHTAPLSYAQQRLWFLDRLQPGLAVYNLPVVLRVEGPLAAGALEASLAEIVRRHAALRTTFAVDPASGEPVQVIAEPARPSLAKVDVSALPAPLRRPETERLLAAEQRRPFDLDRGPLLRSLLITVTPEEHQLALTMHHIVADGWSIGLLLKELQVLYGAACESRPSPLPELPAQYADFAIWQRRWLAEGELESQLEWWRQHLAGSPPTLALPTDRPRPLLQSQRGAGETLTLDAELAAVVERLGHRQGTTQFMTLLAAFEALLHRYTGEEDLWVGTPVAGRSRAELENLIGIFVNTLVLRTEVGSGASFTELLGRVRETALGAYAHPDVPFEKLVEELAPARDMSRNPLFDVAFSSQDDWTPAAELAPEVSLFRLPAETGTAKFDLSMGFWKSADGTISLGAEYSLDLFEAATVRRMLGHFVVLLAAAAARPETRLEDLPLLTAEEREQLRAAWNGGDPVPSSAPTLHGLFERQARRAPGAVAILTGAERLTYGELDAMACGVAQRLLDLGVTPEARVALCTGRSPELAAGFLGVLQAGGACVPLDPAHPADRLDFALQDAGAVALVTTPELAPRLPASLPRVLVTRDVAGSAAVSAAPAPPEQLAYVIYTSGSTGRPKGVAVAHGAAVQHCEAAARRYGLAPDDRVLLFASPAFDVAVEQIFATFAAGATLVTAGEETWVPSDLTRKVEALGVSVVNPPTAVWQQWVEALESLAAPPPSLRLVIVGGEEMRAAPARRWLRTPCAPVRLLNGYGPTEAVITATVHEVGAAGPGDGTSIPIGRPFPGRCARVLSPGMNPAPVGVPGELYLAGGGLARGYLGRPELTAERFLPDPFGEPGARMYRTGDLARLRSDGELEYLGRLDEQVKIRGFRIELGEIEAALADNPGVAAAVVAAREDFPGKRRLVAYLVPRNGHTDPVALRNSLRGRLPEYMIPAAFVILPALPLTSSGKIDRRALPAPEAGEESSDTFLAPRTPLEQQIAAIWQEVLQVGRVGVHDNFWEMGGHSLLATRVLARVNEAFDLQMPLHSLFAAPMLGEFAAAIGEASLAAYGDGLEEALAELDALPEGEIQALLAEAGRLAGAADKLKDLA
jgi:amino acid adenylation domain-containing protein